MAKQRKSLPARRANAVDNSLLIRSAESLGRMIGSLQRQLDAARQLTVISDGTKRRSNGEVRGSNGEVRAVHSTGVGTKRKTTKKTAAARTSAAAKSATGGTSRRRTKRQPAAKARRGT
jgi:hypothetical protein